jgi:hypothetical protein
MTLKVTDTSSSDAFIGPGNFLVLDFGSGASTYKKYVSGDATEPFELGIGDTLPPNQVTCPT